MMAEQTVETEAEDLSEDLLAIHDATVSSSTVIAEVTDVSKRSETLITVTFQLPNGEAVTETLEMPIPWSRQHLFVRIMDEFDYGPANVHLLEGERVEARRTDDGDWRLADPAPWWIGYIKQLYRIPSRPEVVVAIFATMLLAVPITTYFTLRAPSAAIEFSFFAGMFSIIAFMAAVGFREGTR